MTFDERVYRVVRRIPRGRVMTYGQIAALLARPRSARAVGGAMRHCPPGVPWHRVVNAQGGISFRSRVASMVTQRILLEREGVRVRGGRVSLRRVRFIPREVHHEAGAPSELLGGRDHDRHRAGSRGRAPRVRFDLDR